jgi:hypothetical protein
MKKYILKSGLALATFVAFCTNASAYTAVASGNWSSAATWGGTAPGATVSSQDIVIPSSVSVNLDMNVTFTGTPINSFTVNGMLTNSTDYALTLTEGSLAGTGTISIAMVEFQSLATTTFTGTMNVKHLKNSGATLVFTSIANVADTLNMEAGSLVLNTGANITMVTNSTVRMNSGTMTASGGTFNTGNNYNVLYVGGSKTAGLELNSSMLKNLYIKLTDNTHAVTLANSLVINGNTVITAGVLDLTGKQVTFKGDVNMATGSMLTSTSASSIMFQGTASPSTGIYFSTGSAINDFTVDMTNSSQVKLMSALAIAGHLKLMNGSFGLASGGALTMNAASVVHVENGSIAMNSGTFNGTAAYDVEYMGGATSAGLEVTGSGLHNLSLSLVNSVSIVKLNKSATVAGKLNLSSGKLDLGADTLTVNGSMAQTPSAAFIGNASAALILNLTSVTNDTLYFDQSNQNLKKLKVNLANGGNVVLATALTIGGELDFVKGKVVLINNDLQISSAAAMNGYDDTKYVATEAAGRLQMTVNSGSSFATFPVGTLSNYSPAGIQQTASGSTGSFMVRAMNGVMTQGTTGYNTANSASVVNRTWLIDAASGVNVNMNLKLAWVSAAEVNSFDRTHAYIAHYKNATWDTYTYGAAVVGVNNTYEITRQNITSLSPFAVSDNLAAMGIKEVVAENGIDMYPNPSSDVVNIQVSNSGSAYSYEIIDITGQTILASANNNALNRFDVSNLQNGCYFIKITNLDNKKVVTKRFIKS